MLNARTRCKIYLTLAFALLIFAACAESFAPHDPYAQNLELALLPPNSTYPCGTDRYGRCIFSRVLAGSTVSVYASLLLVALTSLTGTLLGLTAAFRGGRTDYFIMRAADVFLSFPGLVLALAVASFSGGGLGSAIFALAAIAWPKYARLMRSRVLAVQNLPYITAAKTWGYSSSEIFFTQLLPASLGPVLSMAALDIGTMLLELAALSFLGLGVQPPAAEWGSMLAGGRSLLQLTPWAIFAPALALVLTVSIFNLLGESLRELLDVDVDYL